MSLADQVELHHQPHSGEWEAILTDEDHTRKMVIVGESGYLAVELAKKAEEATKPDDGFIPLALR